MKRRLKVYQRQYAAGELEGKDVRQRLMSWLGHAKHGHTYHLRTEILREAAFVVNREQICIKQKEDDNLD